MPRPPLWLLLLAALVFPSSAFASKVEVLTTADCGGDLACSKYAGGQPRYVLNFSGTDAEANDVKMTLEPDGLHIVVSDAGAPLTPGGRCTARDDHAVVCDVSGFPLGTFPISLGDGNDRFTLADQIKAGVTVDGGAGDDELHGASGADTLTGGPGRDTLTGGAGNDTFPQGSAADTDTIDGGAGSNTVDYSARKGAIRAHLTDPAAVQGEAGEADTLTRVQNVYGGGGDDELSGDANVNSLRGGPGDDVISADAGNDLISPGDGRDQVDAGAGNDYIDARDAKPDTIACGAGKDEIGSVEYDGEYLDEPTWLGPDAGDRLGADCEAVWLDGWTEVEAVVVPIQMRRRGNIVSLSNPCRVAEVRRGCKGSVRVGKRTTRRFSAKAKRVSMRLDRRDRAAARRGPIRLSILLGQNRDYSVDVTTLILTGS